MPVSRSLLFLTGTCCHLNAAVRRDEDAMTCFHSVKTVKTVKTVAYFPEVIPGPYVICC
jgi:hypothetical protein